MIDKTPLETDEWRPASSRRKNTKRWCRGKVGVEHQPVVQVDKSAQHLDEICMRRHGKTYCEVHADNLNRIYCIHRVACSACGKTLALSPDVCPTTNRVFR